MSDDIFIKHPAAFQQPYIARASKNAQEPVIAQRDARTPAIYQVPSTYTHRSPSTYQNPVSTQNPFIRNQQEPNIRSQQEPNIRAQQIPFTYQHRSPTTYNHRSPSSYQHRSPSIYQVAYQARQPSTYQHRSPGTYRSPVAYRHPIIYQHRSPSSYQATGRNPVIYQHQSPSTYTHRSPSIANAQNPFIRNAQTPFTYVFRSPSIGSYQTTYSHQQPATGFLAVSRTESIATLTELITGFGTGNGIPNDNNTINGNKQGAGSLLVSDFNMDIATDGGLATAMAGGGFTFNVGYSGNDVVISVKEGGQTFGTPRMSRIGNMSSSSSSSFSYTNSNVSSSSFSEIARFSNIGSGRGQVKLNFPDPTASPYSINTGTSSSGWAFTDQNYNAEGSGSDGDQGVDYCVPVQWPRTTISSPFFTETTSGSGSSITSTKFFYQGESGNSNQITTSYQNIPTSGASGFEIGSIEAASANDSAGSSDSVEGLSTIVEIIVKDLDGGTEYKLDLLIIFALAVTAESNDDDEFDGE